MEKVEKVEKVVWRAPGKLVLIGEYAVLDGAAAFVAAVDRGVCCEVTPVEAGAPGSLTVPGGDDRFARAGLGWDSGPEHSPEHRQAHGRAPAAHYRFSDWNPPELPSKAGFGGSAAAVVAARLAGGLPVAAAMEIHRRVQGGGSGIDVFASMRGGVRRFPDGLEIGLPPMIAVWSGRSAKTGPRVQHWRGWEGRAAFVAESRALVAAFPDDPIRVLPEAYRLLCAMAADAGLSAAGLAYDTPALRRIAEIAAAYGGAAKPSGAGGGDVAVALFPDVERQAAFAEAIRAEITAEGAGLVPLAVRVAGPSQVI